MEKKLQENHDFAKMRHGELIYNDVTGRRAASVRSTCDYSGLGKNNENHINKTHCDNSECNSISHTEQNEQPHTGRQVSLLNLKWRKIRPSRSPFVIKTDFSIPSLHS